MKWKIYRLLEGREEVSKMAFLEGNTAEEVRVAGRTLRVARCRFHAQVTRAAENDIFGR
jgi:hypothetical protein